MPWQVRRDGGDIVAEDERGRTYRCNVSAAECVRVVPLQAGSQHMRSSGWQVAIRTRNGDVLFGKASQDWRPAHALAQQLCEVAGLPLDELTKGLFSKVGWNERGASRL